MIKEYCDVCQNEISTNDKKYYVFLGESKLPLYFPFSEEKDIVLTICENCRAQILSAINRR